MEKTASSKFVPQERTVHHPREQQLNFQIQVQWMTKATHARTHDHSCVVWWVCYYRNQQFTLGIACWNGNSRIFSTREKSGLLKLPSLIIPAYENNQNTILNDKYKWLPPPLSKSWWIYQLAHTSIDPRELSYLQSVWEIRPPVGKTVSDR